MQPFNKLSITRGRALPIAGRAGRSKFHGGKKISEIVCACLGSGKVLAAENTTGAAAKSAPRGSKMDAKKAAPVRRASPPSPALQGQLAVSLNLTR